jgi:hypothetical protein
MKTSGHADESGKLFDLKDINAASGFHTGGPEKWHSLCWSQQQ